MLDNPVPKILCALTRPMSDNFTSLLLVYHLPNIAKGFRIYRGHKLVLGLYNLFVIFKYYMSPILFWITVVTQVEIIFDVNKKLFLKYFIFLNDS